MQSAHLRPNLTSTFCAFTSPKIFCRYVFCIWKLSFKSLVKCCRSAECVQHQCRMQSADLTPILTATFCPFTSPKILCRYVFCIWKLSFKSLVKCCLDS